MSRAPRRPALIALFAVSAIIFGACAGNTTPSPTTASAAPPAGSEAPSSEAPGSAAPIEARSYPETAVDCVNRPEYTEGANKATYTGIISQIVAVDAKTVEFHLCAPDVAFLSKLAFASNNIQDSDWLAAHAPDKSYVHDAINGTGPYQLQEWVPGDHLTLTANPNYWGEAPKSPTVVWRWSKEPAQRLQELLAGTADGIDNLGSDDFATVEGNPDLQLKPREALNVLYLGMNVNQAPWDDEKIRQAIAIGIDGGRIAENFYPAGSERAEYFTPCAIPGGCEGDPWPAFDAAAAKQALTDAGFDFTKTYPLHYRTQARSYLGDPTGVATDIQAQFKDNLGIDIELVVEKDDTFLGDASKGKFPLFLLGWGADYPDVTNFLDVFFGNGADSKFGPKFDDITAPLAQGAALSDPAERAAVYAEANNAIRTHVPMVPLLHGGSATAWLADVEGAHSSPIGSEYMYTVTPGDRDQLVWMQNAEPSGLYCGDESDGDALRTCEQIFDSLYNFETAGLDPVPALATECAPNETLDLWTCTLRDGVKFQQGGVLDANDVVDTFAVQWDVAHPLHVGNVGANWYWSYLFGGCLNPSFDKDGAQSCAVAAPS
jgi:peptide/nickel transport system substrate-binding protein